MAKPVSPQTPQPVDPQTNRGTNAAVERLEQLALELECASKEANAMAESVRRGVADELARHLIHLPARRQ